MDSETKRNLFETALFLEKIGNDIESMDYDEELLDKIHQTMYDGGLLEEYVSFVNAKLATA